MIKTTYTTNKANYIMLRMSPASISSLPEFDAPDLRDQARRDWLAAIANGDETALVALYDDSASKVYGLALRITGKPEAAKEVTSDVYMQIWNCAQRYDVIRSKALTWILMLCRSRAMDSLRRRDQAESHPDPALLRAEVEDANNPVDLLLTIENSGALHAALAVLMPLQRQFIALAFFKGLTHQEIAEHTGLPLGTVKSHLRRALEQLKRILSTQQ